MGGQRCGKSYSNDYFQVDPRYTPAKPTGSGYYQWKSSNPPSCKAGKPLPAKSMRFSGTFGKKRWNRIGLLEAIKVVEWYIDTEKKACYHLVYTINQDQWFVSFVSELLGGKEPPNQTEWSKALMTIWSARRAYARNDGSQARSYLEYAIASYNSLHRKWIEYQNGIDKGAKDAIDYIEYTIIVLSAMVTGGLGAGKGLLVKGGIAAGGAAYTTTAKELGKVYIYNVEKKLDIPKIVAESLTSFLTSVIGGKLSEKFLKNFADEFWKGVIGNPKLVQAYKNAGVLVPKPSVLKPYLKEFLLSTGVNSGGEMLKNAVLSAVRQSKGRKLTMGSFLDLVYKEAIKQGIQDGTAKFAVSKLIRKKT